MIIMKYQNAETFTQINCLNTTKKFSSIFFQVRKTQLTFESNFCFLGTLLETKIFMSLKCTSLKKYLLHVSMGQWIFKSILLRVKTENVQLKQKTVAVSDPFILLHSKCSLFINMSLLRNKTWNVSFLANTKFNRCKLH